MGEATNATPWVSRPSAKYAKQCPTTWKPKTQRPDLTVTMAQG